MSEVSNNNTAVQFNNSSVYSVNDQGRVEEKSFFGRIWSDLKSLVASGRSSIAHDNQQVLLSLFKDFGMKQLTGLDFESFRDLASPDLLSGSRAIRGRDIASIREQVQTIEADNEKAFLSKIARDIRSEMSGTGAKHILAPANKFAPFDIYLSAGQANSIGRMVASQLPGVIGPDGRVNQEEVSRYLAEMDSEEFNNLSWSIDQKFITADDNRRQLTSLQSKDKAHNTKEIMSATRSHLLSLKAAETPGIADGAGALDAQAPAVSAARNEDVSRVNFVRNLLHGGDQASELNELGFANEIHHDILVRGLVEDSTAKYSDIKNLMGAGTFLRAGGPPQTYRLVAGAVMAPFHEALQRAGAETKIMGKDGKEYSLSAALTQLKTQSNELPNFDLTELKSICIQTVKNVFARQESSYNDMVGTMHDLTIIGRNSVFAYMILKGGQMTADERSLSMAKTMRQVASALILGQTAQGTGPSFYGQVYTAFINPALRKFENPDPEVMEFVGEMLGSNFSDPINRPKAAGQGDLGARVDQKDRALL